MDNTAYVALSRMNALSRQMEVVANNLANVNTPGFKGEDTVFTKYLVSVPTDDRMINDKVAFAHDLGLVRNLDEGHFMQTNNPLDVAIHGKGYFVIDAPAGERYARLGQFRLDQDGQLVTKAGHPVMSANNEPFFFAPNESNIVISQDGTISTENGEIGKLRVVEFDNEQALKKVAGGLYSTDQDPKDVEQPYLSQGMQEQSNVEAITEVTKLIHIQRSYERVAKLIELESDRQKRAVSAITKLAG